MKSQKGVTLTELVVVLSLVAILAALSTTTVYKWNNRNKVENDASALYADIRWAQVEAEKQGEVTVTANGRLLKRKIYVALDPANRNYSIWRWQDENENNVPETGEFNRDFLNDPANDQPLRRGRLENTDFGIDPDVTRIGCSNNPGTPAGGIVNLMNCPSVICSNCDCIRFNGKGFNEGMNNASIYLTNFKYSSFTTNTSAINLNLAGTASMCWWDKDAGFWKPLR